MACMYRTLGRLAFTRCTNRHLTISQHSNIGHINAIFQPGKLGISLTGHRRYFSTEDTSIKQRLSSYERKLRDLAAEDLEQIRDDETLRSCNKSSLLSWESMSTDVVHRSILEERAQEKAPMVEPVLSIRRKILSLETLIAPELENPQKVLGDQCEPEPILSYQYYPEFIQKKWSLILQKRDHPLVKELLELMETAHVPQDIFIQTLAKFSFVPLKNIIMHARTLSNFTPEQVEYSLQRHFTLEYTDDLNLAIKSITHVLMKA